jgi:hypothetical protein
MRGVTKFVVLWAVGGAVACGPSISEMRMRALPGREASCALQFVPMDRDLQSGTGRWEIVGYVTLSETGMADPFAPRYRDLVRPRACAMGGTAVTLFANATNSYAISSGSTTAYAVLTERNAAAPAGPQPF